MKEVRGKNMDDNSESLIMTTDGVMLTQALDWEMFEESKVNNEIAQGFTTVISHGTLEPKDITNIQCDTEVALELHNVDHNYICVSITAYITGKHYKKHGKPKVFFNVLKFDGE
jgi:hypothetical protein